MFFFFCCWYGKGLLNFVRERIKLVYRVNNTLLAFRTSKTIIYRPHTPELKSISKFQLLFHWRNFEKYMIFTLDLEAGETELINYEIIFSLKYLPQRIDSRNTKGTVLEIPGIILLS